MKLCLVLVVVLAICVTINAQSHNYSWGAPAGGDVLLRREVVKVSSKLLRKVSKDFEFNQNGLTYPPRVITYVVVTDQKKNGNGGFAKLVSGGPQMTSVKLHLKSQRNHGINYVIDVYGK